MASTVIILPPFSVGGDSKLSLAANRNRSNTSQVPLVNMVDFSATSFMHLSTLWHCTACLRTKSTTVNKTSIFILFFTLVSNLIFHHLYILPIPEIFLALTKQTPNFVINKSFGTKLWWHISATTKTLDEIHHVDLR